MSAALTAEGLNTYYGKSHILRDVSMDVAEGQITTLLGRNGAGKTTTLRMVLGLLQPTSGQASIAGFGSSEHPDEVKRRVGYRPSWQPSLISWNCSAAMMAQICQFTEPCDCYRPVC
jgi:ABC-type multidrug transport system ATPase subunit